MAGRSRIMRELGIEPVINAHGHPTTIGGNNPSRAVREAMDDASLDYVRMSDLVEVTGDRIAEMLGVPAAIVTPGCAAALALSAAACITRDHPDRMEQLPDTTGMPNEFIIQRQLRVIYDKALTVPGGVLVEVGDEDGTTEEHIEAAISERTAGIHYLAGGLYEDPGLREERTDIVPFSRLVALARRHGLPLVVDAAGQVYPTERLSLYARGGADLVGYGGKYFEGLNTSGLLVGANPELVRLAYRHSFVGFEYEQKRVFGRSMKMDRQTVIATYVALREWLATDHEARAGGLRAPPVRDRATGADGHRRHRGEGLPRPRPPRGPARRHRPRGGRHHGRAGHGGAGRGQPAHTRQDGRRPRLVHHPHPDRRRGRRGGDSREDQGDPRRLSRRRPPPPAQEAVRLARHRPDPRRPRGRGAGPRPPGPGGAPRPCARARRAPARHPAGGGRAARPPQRGEQGDRQGRAPGPRSRREDARRVGQHQGPGGGGPHRRGRDPPGAARHPQPAQGAGPRGPRRVAQRGGARRRRARRARRLGQAPLGAGGAAGHHRPRGRGKDIRGALLRPAGPGGQAAARADLLDAGRAHPRARLHRALPALPGRHRDGHRERPPPRSSRTRCTATARTTCG